MLDWPPNALGVDEGGVLEKPPKADDDVVEAATGWPPPKTDVPLELVEVVPKTELEVVAAGVLPKTEEEAVDAASPNMEGLPPNTELAAVVTAAPNSEVEVVVDAVVETADETPPKLDGMAADALPPNMVGAELVGEAFEAPPNIDPVVAEPPKTDLVMAVAVAADVPKTDPDEEGVPPKILELEEPPPKMLVEVLVPDDGTEEDAAFPKTPAAAGAVVVTVDDTDPAVVVEGAVATEVAKGDAEVDADGKDDFPKMDVEAVTEGAAPKTEEVVVAGAAAAVTGVTVIPDPRLGKLEGTGVVAEPKTEAGELLVIVFSAVVVETEVVVGALALAVVDAAEGAGVLELFATGADPNTDPAVESANFPKTEVELETEPNTDEGVVVTAVNPKEGALVVGAMDAGVAVINPVPKEGFVEGVIAAAGVDIVANWVLTTS